MLSARDGGPHYAIGVLMTDNAQSTGVIAALDRAKELYKERNSSYRDAWQKEGEIMALLFQDGAPVDNASFATKHYLVGMIVSKLLRLCAQGCEHKDSADDLVAYAAMLSSAVHDGAGRDALGSANALVEYGRGSLHLTDIVNRWASNN